MMQCVLQISVGLISSSQDKWTEFTLTVLNTVASLSFGEKRLRTEDAKLQCPHFCNEDLVIWDIPNRDVSFKEKITHTHHTYDGINNFCHFYDCKNFLFETDFHFVVQVRLELVSSCLSLWIIGLCPHT